MRGILALIEPWDRSTNSFRQVYVGAARNSRTLGCDGRQWETAFIRLPRLSMEFVDDDVTGKLMLARGDMTLSAKKLTKVPNVDALEWGGARVVIMSGDGPLLSDMRVEFNGRIKSGVKNRDTGHIPITMEVDRKLVDVPLLNQEYGGGGGADGDPEVRGQLKPAAFGRPINVPVFFFDQTNNVGQFDAYGNTLGVAGLYEDGGSFGPSAGNYASYAALVAANLAEGTWATCFAEGMIRLGAPPQGLITCDPICGADRPGSLALRWLTAHAGVSLSNINVASFDNLTAQVEALLGRAAPVNYWTQSQVNTLDRLQRLAASCNAMPQIGFDGKVSVARVFGGDVELVIDRQGGRPLVTAWRTLDPTTPWWRLKMSAAVTYRKHSDQEIDFEDDIDDRGDYVPGETYRIGQVARNPADGIRYLYTSATPSSGNAPPNPLFWEVYEDAPDASVVKFLDGTPVQARQPQEAGANKTETRTSSSIAGQGVLATSNYARLGDTVRRADGVTTVTDALAITSLGTASGIAGQGTLATRGDVLFGTHVKRADGSTVVTDAMAVTALGTASGIAGQGALATLAQVNLGSSGRVYREDAITRLTDALAVTALGVASAIAGQGALATLAQVNLGASGRVYREDAITRLTDALAVTALGTASGISGQGALATRANVHFGSTFLLEAAAGAQATLGNFKTAMGTASGISGQGALATLNAAAWSTQVTGVGKPADYAGTTLNLYAVGAGTVEIQGNRAKLTSTTDWGSTVLARESFKNSAFAFGRFTGGYYSFIGLTTNLTPIAGNQDHVRLYNTYCIAFNLGGGSGGCRIYAAGVMIYDGYPPGVVVSPNTFYGPVYNGRRVAFMIGDVEVASVAAPPGLILTPRIDNWYLGAEVSDFKAGPAGDVTTYRDDGFTIMAQAEIRTGEGTAAAIAGQGLLATRGDVHFGSSYLLEAAGGAQATLSGFKTAMGTASAVAGQGALATLSQVGSAHIGTGSVIGSKIALGDTSNLIADSDMVDPAAWSGAAYTSHVPPAGIGYASKRFFRIYASAQQQGISSKPFPVEGGAPYRVSAIIAGPNDPQFGWSGIVWYSDPEATQGLSESLLGYKVHGAFGSAAAARNQNTFIAPDGAMSARIHFTRGAGGTGALDFAEPIVRRAASYDLLTSDAVRLGGNVRRANGTTLVNDADAITAMGTASGISGQGVLATANQVNFGPSGRVYRDDGFTKVTDSLAITSMGTSAGIAGQGALATRNYTRLGDGSMWDADLNGMLTNLNTLTQLGTAAAIAGQGQLATLSAVSMDVHVVDGTTWVRAAAVAFTLGIPKLQYGDSGVRIGGPRNLPPISAIGAGYKFTGAISYSASASGSATISVGSGQALIGSSPPTYNPMSVVVTGTPGTTVFFHLYCEESANTATWGGTKTLVATTDNNTPYSGDNRMWVGGVNVFFPTTGTSGGSGDGGGGRRYDDGREM